ncbi:peptidylprolyl isomerase [Brevundimonas sp. Root1279]|uniref:peptidylprolyl isomerase n=1 Tax=Brevundimonas sp. Root1279 TaxID=1736443 RepID=UPI0006FA04DE|nr:peptidyl-prolyl cis-trans isomerase [Brevundimonas sp. Root1279]KQW83685.1 hypothetical protein ASC65_03250 [Brevundimonas sp. Root1279]
MISVFRNFAKSKWAVGLLVLVAIGLLVTGGSQVDILGSLQPPTVIKAGDRSLSPQEFRAELDQLREQQQQQQGRPVTFEEMIADGGLPGYLEGRKNELGFFAWAWNAGLRPSKELVWRELRKEQAFFDPLTGQFSQTAFESKLREVNLTPATVIERSRDQFSQIHFGTGLNAGARLPRIYGAIVANQTKQVRDGSWFVLNQSMAGAAPAPTDAQLQTLMTQNRDRWSNPEFRSGALVLFHNPADANLPISEEKIQARFDFRKDALSVPERRSFVTLTAPNKATADRIAAALRAGQAPEAVASANNLQPAPFTDTPRSAISDPAVAAAVFGAASGEVTAPVQARVGYVVAAVSSITPGREAALSDVREQVIQELRGQEMRGAIARRVEAYEAARREGKSVDEAVRQVGAQVVPISPISREGRNPQRQQINAPANILEAMWKLTEGRASEVISAGDGQYFVVRVDDITPAAMPALNDVREAVTRDWTARENARLLSAKTDELVGRLRRGEDINTVAASVGATVITRAGVQQSEEAVAELGQGVLVGLFSAERGQPFSRPQGNDGIAIGRVTGIIAPTPAVAADEARQWQARFGPQTGQAFFQTAIQAGAVRSNASYNEAVARQALGVAPAETPAAPAKKK